MLTLAERFELQWPVSANRCAIGGRPGVRVTDVLAPPPPARVTRPVLPAASLGTGPVRSDTVASPVASTRMMTVGQLEHLLEKTPAMNAATWEAQEGADRAFWLLPRERIEIYADRSLALRERLIRTVLSEWDFTDPLGWRSQLAQAVAAQPDSAAARQFAEELEALFTRLVLSPLFPELAQVRPELCEAEYALTLRGEEDLFGEAEPVIVAGIVDVAWQEPPGQWHVLLFDTVAAAGTSAKRVWQLRHLSWTLAAQAVHLQFGAWPKSVRRYHCADGVTVSRTGQRLPVHKVQQAILGARLENQ